MPAIRKFDLEQDGDSFTMIARAWLLIIAGIAYSLFMLALVVATLAVLTLLATGIGKSGNPLLIAALGVPLAAFGYAAYRSVRLRLPVPQGLPLGCDETTAMWREIDRLGKRTGAPTIDGIVVDEEFRAVIVPAGKVGLLGARQNYLVVGLPLLQALSKDQFRALAVRELCQLSAAKGLRVTWARNLHRTWLRLSESFEDRDDFGLFIARWFSKSYSTTLAGVALRSDTEVKADLTAAEVVGVDCVVEMMLALVTARAFLREEVWPAVYKRADQQPNPPEAPYDEVAAALRFGPASSDRARQWIDEALTADGATMGRGLADRLAALGGEPRVTHSLVESAGEVFLGSAYPAIKATLNRRWSKAIGRSWRDWYAYVSQAKERFQEVPLGLAQQLTPAEAWQQACFVEEFQGGDGALPLYREFAAKHPNHAAAHFAVGRILLANQDAEGIVLVLKAMNLDADYAKRGSELIFRFLRARGKKQREDVTEASHPDEKDGERIQLALQRREVV